MTTLEQYVGELVDILTLTPDHLCAVQPYDRRQQPVQGTDAEWTPLVPVPAQYGAVCGRCYGRMRWWMRQAPQLVAHIRSMVPPVMQSERGPRVSGTPDLRIPLNAQAVEDADDVYAQLVNWIVNLAHTLGLRPPASTIGWAKRGIDPAGLPADALDQESAYTLVEDLTRWWQIHELTAVERLPKHTLRAFHDDLGEIISPMLGRYPQAPQRRSRAQVCTTCGARSVEASFWADGTPLVQCRACGERVDHEPAETWAATPTLVKSSQCTAGKHAKPGTASGCRSFNCDCDCHGYPTGMRRHL